MGEGKGDNGRLPGTPPRRRRVHSWRENQRTPGNGASGEHGEPGSRARMPRDVAAVLDKLRTAAAAHDSDLKYEFLEAG